MRKFPKFLKVMPTFYGLVPLDLVGLGIGLFISMLLGLSSIAALVVSGVIMGSLKIVRRYFDVVGFLLPRKKEIRLKGGSYDASL